jgi:hypothetical protein
MRPTDRNEPGHGQRTRSAGHARLAKQLKPLCMAWHVGGDGVQLEQMFRRGNSNWLVPLSPGHGRTWPSAVGVVSSASPR